MLPKIKIQVIPHGLQRYETVGDWYYKHPGSLQVRISDLGDADFEFLVTMHELIEAYLCHKRGISEEAVTSFDKEFEDNRVKGNTVEPGAAPKAPYRKEHHFATYIERLLATELGVDWAVYEEAVTAL